MAGLLPLRLLVRATLVERAHARVGSLGAMTLFKALREEHLAFAKHVAAETKTEEFVPGKAWSFAGSESESTITGSTRCTTPRRQDICGARLLGDEEPIKPPKR